MIFKKLLSKFFFVYLLLEKIINRKYFSINKKYFSIKKKFRLVFKKLFFFYFERKIFFKSYEKFRNVILFVDYIKFGPQIFYCYIYFVLNIFFQFHPLKFNFYVNFDPHFYFAFPLSFFN